MTAKVVIETISKSADAQKDLQKLTDGFEKLTGISIGAAAAIGGVSSFLADSVKAAIEAEKADANLNATLESTKFAAGMTAKEIKNLSGSLAEMSGQDDEAIQNANSMLLTFTKIGKEVFPQASLAMVNMAAKFGGIESASVQLGKALNDPVEGVSALRRVGVALTAQQEDSIKQFMEVNDVASAQKVILSELETEFGGLAAAMGQTLEGKVNRLNTAIGNLKEEIGAGLIPTLADAAEGLNLLLTYSKKLDDAFQKHSEEVVAVTETYEAYGREMIASMIRSRGLKGTTEEVDRAIQAQGKSLEETMIQLGYKTIAEWEAVNAAKALAKETKENTITGHGWKKSLEDLQKALDNTTISMEAQERELAMLSIASGKHKVEVDKNIVSANALLEKYGALTKAYIFNTLAVGMDEKSMLALGVSMGIITPQVKAARDAVDELARSTSEAMKQTKAYVGQTEALAAAIAKLEGKDIPINVYYNYYGQRMTPGEAAITNPQPEGGPGSSGSSMTEAQLQAYLAAQAAAERERKKREAEAERIK